MRALIVDDEPAARRRLATMLEELGVEIEGEAPDGLSALTLAGERRPDVIFLDVVDAGGRWIRRRPPPARAAAAHHLPDGVREFAVKAFEHEALDYVVKPVTPRAARTWRSTARSAVSPARGARAAWPSDTCRISERPSATRRRGPNGCSCATVRLIGSIDGRRRSSGSRPTSDSFTPSQDRRGTVPTTRCRSSKGDSAVHSCGRTVPSW